MKLQRIMQYQLPRFLIVGSIGFLVDASFLHLFHLIFNLIPSRIISFTIAVTCTWILNRTFTFQSNDPKYKSEWLRYTVVNTLGGCINFFGFIVLIHHFPLLHTYPIAALALATTLSALVNFMFSRHFAFQQNTNKQSSLS